MTRDPGKHPFSYDARAETRRYELTLAVHEPRPPGAPTRVPSTIPAARSDDSALTRRLFQPSTTRVRLHLKPGQKGTKLLLAQYGERLVCVRYHCDAQRKKRFKTVELLVADRDCEPPHPRVAPDRIVALRIAFAEAHLRDRMKRAGGT